MLEESEYGVSGKVRNDARVVGDRSVGDNVVPTLMSLASATTPASPSFVSLKERRVSELNANDVVGIEVSDNGFWVVLWMKASNDLSKSVNPVEPRGLPSKDKC